MRTSRSSTPPVAAGVVLAAAIAMLSGCSGASSAPTSPSAPAFAIDADFPDPDVLTTEDGYVAYATNAPGFNIRMATSPDLTDWTVSSSDALPTLPTWATAGKTWAPDVSEFAPGQYVMYFVAADTATHTQCIGRAIASDPAGPFVPDDEGPIVCPTEDGGAIDPDTFVDDDGTRYLIFKNDGNCCGIDTWLQAAPLSADGSALTAAPVKLIKQTKAWEGNLIEAPTLVKHGAEYVLFYSANDYSGSSYAIGYATSRSLLGPYTKPSQPLVTTTSTGGRYTGPGGQDVVTARDGTQRLVIHSWSDGVVYRGMSVLRLSWKGGIPIVAGSRS
jgi:arabinan endo-1,5-alpha-L-arabinosidase